MTHSTKLFSQITFRGVTLKNRVVISPMGTYSAENGILQPFHHTHYPAFAMGGAGLVMVEQTSITRQGRITNGDLGMWADSQIEGMRALTSHVKSYGAKIGIQLNHGGRKCAMQRAFRGNGPLTERDLASGEEIWTPLAPSAIPLGEGWQVPEEITLGQLDGLRDAWVAAARRAVLAGFDLIEIHMAHGYLLQNFLSPLANQRSDGYGGDLDSRMRFPLEVVRAIRAVVPQSMPLFARISATDWIEGGWTLEDSIVLSQELKAAGIDVIDCSSGGNLRTGATNASLGRGPGYQVPFAESIRNRVGIATAAVGMIRTAQFAESILQEGRADLICIARQALFDPFWAHHAADALGVNHGFADWPAQYGWWLEKWAKALQANGETPNGPEVFPTVAPPFAVGPARCEERLA
ncbi:NADH:flavin oxidoreductase/NADH oxidase [Paracoccus sp. (in: a-proteobacteria)]|uniref:NADH:flavin oxidoreductase/NADH oxidase n=1 Tax=Paracoccus sp. TaxID=267 RepID=UPI002897C05D|nr:NADH:flavin oxidoreductase/NADH oxidase [Paracoccus sp. (in: a-proteobacteria)]